MVRLAVGLALAWVTALAVPHAEGNRAAGGQRDVGEAGRRTTPAACPFDGADAAWLQETLRVWDRVAVEDLRQPGGALPWLVLFDAICVWHVGPDPAVLDLRAATRTTIRHQGQALDVFGMASGGGVLLPEGDEMPRRLTSFASTYGPDRRPYLVMAMPGIWRAEPRHRDDDRLDVLIRSVFVHEMTHTRHAATYGARLDALAAQYGLEADLDDDIVQRRFVDREGFRAAFERERHLLYRAAADPDAARRRALAAEAVASAQARRARHFTGAEAFYAELEDLFLVMEGVANWAAYRSAVREGLDSAAALALVRRGGRFWSQDAGLAAVLVLDTSVPGWQRELFAASPASLYTLLARV